jgi:hypothetical protein
MTSGIGGSGGVGGPRGPDAASGPGSTSGVEAPGEALTIESTAGPRASSVDRLAADLQSGRVSADQALAELISEAVPGGLADLDRAELQAALGDLLATDPYLAGLAARLGATPPDDGG